MCNMFVQNIKFLSHKLIFEGYVYMSLRHSNLRSNKNFKYRSDTNIWIMLMDDGIRLLQFIQ